MPAARVPLLQKYNKYDINRCKFHTPSESRNWSIVSKTVHVGVRVRGSLKLLYAARSMSPHVLCTYFCSILVHSFYFSNIES